MLRRKTRRRSDTSKQKYTRIRLVEKVGGVRGLWGVHVGLEVPELIKEIYINGKTQSELSKELGLSRQRVSQLVIKSCNKITILSQQDIFQEQLKNILNDKEYFKMTELEEKLISDVVDDNIETLNMLKIITRLIREKEIEVRGFKYVEEMDSLVNKNNITSTLSEIEDIKRELYTLPDIIHYKDLVYSIAKLLKEKFIKTNTLSRIIKNSNYKKYGNYYSRVTITKAEMISVIFRDRLHDPVRIDAEGVLKIKEAVKEEFGIEIKQSLNSITRIIDRTDNILMVDDRTFQDISQLKISEKLKEHLEEYIEKFFKKNIKVVTVDRIYRDLKDILSKEGNIKSVKHLYSIIKYYFGDKFKVNGKSSNMFVLAPGVAHIENKEDIIKEYLIKNNGSMTKKGLLNELAWENYRIDNMVNIIEYTEDGRIQLKNKEE